MRIFYRIQGTGNGHITRGRIMARELRAADIDVTYLFTGRPQDKFFAMEVFNGHQWREGLTFATNKGKQILVKPVRAQMEQAFIAAALSLLGYGQMMQTVDAKRI